MKIKKFVVNFGFFLLRLITSPLVLLVMLLVNLFATLKGLFICLITVYEWIKGDLFEGETRHENLSDYVRFTHFRSNKDLN